MRLAHDTSPSIREVNHNSSIDGIPNPEWRDTLYEAETASGKRFRNTEVMRIRNGRICEVQVFVGWNVPHEGPENR
jgi:ketosteroid isomerase-like protein